ncbi:hypothetical protein Scep_001601 [Stephania cephalantha]|uniref:Transposase, Ptta/En/Spm, plant n=1 Tax=Stephania cephalantha TaxID=152367 RepID=A0AAP0LB39_9MAGN
MAYEKVVSLSGPVTLPINPEIGRPVDESPRLFATECGIIVKNFAPLKLSGWSTIPLHKKVELYDKLKNKFDVDLSLEHIHRFVNGTIANRYRSHWFELRSHIMSFCTVQEAKEARKPKYVETDEEDWNWLCEHFNTDGQKRDPDIGVEPGRKKYGHVKAKEQIAALMEKDEQHEADKREMNARHEIDKKAMNDRLVELESCMARFVGCPPGMTDSDATQPPDSIQK